MNRRSKHIFQFFYDPSYTHVIYYIANSEYFYLHLQGLAHAQNCLKSAETVRAVQKCPENQREWEEAAQRKKCLEIQKYDNCTNVEYHCLVNEFRNKTIEVCTSPRHLQGKYSVIMKYKYRYMHVL